MKQFYETYADTPKLSTRWTQLNWSNNRTIFSRCKRSEERELYLNFTLKERWENRELERQIDTSLFERVLLVDNNLSDVVKNLPQSTENTFRDSYVFEFLDIPKKHSEKTRQQALVSS